MTYGTYEQLLFERRDHGVLLITLNQPQKYNAADEVTHAELARVWADVSRDPDTRVAVVTGTEAERIGLVSTVVPRAQVLDEAPRVADMLAAGPQAAIRWTKKALNSWLRSAGPIFGQSAACEMLGFMGPDVIEGAAALTEKRPPRFPSAQ